MMVSEQLNGEIGADGFLKPGHPFLLIAGSSDVREEMGIAQQTVQEVLREYGIHDVAAYVWDVQAGPEGLDQRRTMQRNIPRPSSDECKGVIYIVGERFGLPMEEGFDISVIGNIEDWTQNGHYCLSPTWPNEAAEERQLLEKGYFPLTGGVFEFLDGRGYRSDDHPEGKPIWLCLLAERPIERENEWMALNGSRWFNERTKDMTPAERTRFQEGEYKRHWLAVHNLMHALAERGISQNPMPTPDKLRRGYAASSHRRSAGPAAFTAIPTASFPTMISRITTPGTSAGINSPGPASTGCWNVLMMGPGSPSSG
ncbi:MAG TPA: hypothetical protein VKQ52_07485 [Puia sp.]|nr:hypothetical protein [Puia sp.]